PRSTRLEAELQHGLSGVQTVRSAPDAHATNVTTKLTWHRSHPDISCSEPAVYAHEDPAITTWKSRRACGSTLDEQDYRTRVDVEDLTALVRREWLLPVRVAAHGEADAAGLDGGAHAGVAVLILEIAVRALVQHEHVDLLIDDAVDEREEAF